MPGENRRNKAIRLIYTSRKTLEHQHDQKRKHIKHSQAAGAVSWYSMQPASRCCWNDIGLPGEDASCHWSLFEESHSKATFFLSRLLKVELLQGSVFQTLTEKWHSETCGNWHRWGHESRTVHSFPLAQSLMKINLASWATLPCSSHCINQNE